MSWFFKKKKDEKKIFETLRDGLTSDGKLIYVGNLLKIACKKFCNQIALVENDKKITYKEFYFRSVCLSEKLISLGLKPKDRVILYSENCIEFYISYFAIWQAGAVVVPVNIFLHEKELNYVVRDSSAVLAIVSQGLKAKWDLAVNSKIETLKNCLTHNEIDWNKKVPQNIEDLDRNFEITNLAPENLCVLLYTSGTTGAPKGVMLSSRNVLINTLQCHARLMNIGKNQKDRFFSVLPLFHVFAQNTCLWLPVMTGSSVIIVNKIDRRLILQGLEKNPTLFFGFPALYGLLCLLKTARLDSIRMFVSGADAMPDKIRAAFSMIYGRKICSGYGLTEAAPVVAVNQNRENLSTEFVGKPLVGIDCQIRNSEGEILKCGEIGTLWIRGENIMMGYYNSKKATEDVLQDGWLNTGDLGCINSEGYLSINGRSKDLIIHKGFNIYPQEIENVLLLHPAVTKAAVIGRQESLSGQIPVAFVEAKNAVLDLESELRKICSDNLAAYKIPREFVCLDDLPISSTGKINKKQLQTY